MKKVHSVIIREAYKNWSPPVHAARAVDRLLNGIPKKRLSGLESVVITNSANLSHGERKGKMKSRGRKVRMVRCGGFYYEKWKGEPAWIQLLLDNMLEQWPTWMLRVPFFRDLAFSKTLFHELGHHIHATQAPQHKEPEDVAEDWRDKLTGYYFRRQYWYLAPLFFTLWLLLKPLYWMTKKRKKVNK
jgi:hypothetical protein